MIKVKNLSKRFGVKLAVDQLSFSVKKGEVLGFLGPNGAGKSTTMRMITGFLSPDEGSITIGQYDMEENPIQAKAKIGYLPENAPAYEDMTVIAFLKFIASLRGLSGKSRQESVEKVIETCFLQPVRHQTIETLSKGFLHRTCFAQSILHDPEVLILDEPTDGLDPNQKYEVRRLIKRMGERKAIVLSTHILEEVDAVCDRVIIINNGKIIVNSTPKELKKQSDTAGSVTVIVEGKSFSDIEKHFKSLPYVNNVLCIKEDDSQCQICITGKDPEDRLEQAVYRTIVAEKWNISRLYKEAGKLDNVFRQVTTSDVQDKI